MIGAIGRKATKFAEDGTLRRWFFGRIFGKWSGHPPYRKHVPPYLEDYLPLSPENPSSNFSALEKVKARGKISINLPGKSIVIAPNEIQELFEHKFPDIETILALHRFAWLPISSSKIDPAWVSEIWKTWIDCFSNLESGWPWHPYTVAERAINILDFVRNHGIPGRESETLNALAMHATAIAARLEYFGENYTGNHLSNNGRGLYRLGLELGLSAATKLGAEILKNEAERLFLPSGMLREGSSHYQLLLARNYLDAALAARRYNHHNQADFEQIAQKALAAAAALRLGGGFPLIGDISPDVPPDYLICLVSNQIESGWVSTLSEEERGQVIRLTDGIADQKVLASDGWIRKDHGPWSGLWHVPPKGWCYTPGHGHEDFGTFELHCGTEPVLVDPGRGSYGEKGDAAFYRSGKVHNLLLVDDTDPFPPNKPYYDESFKHYICGDWPKVKTTPVLKIAHNGYSRLPGVGMVTRAYMELAAGWRITSQVEGNSRRTISQRFVTPLGVEVCGNEVFLRGNRLYRLRAKSAWRVQKIIKWTAYGKGSPGNMLILDNCTVLPFFSQIELEII